MGCHMHNTIARTEEYRAAWLSEMEFAEKAHVLKMLARELGEDNAPVIDELARHGLDAALGVLAGAAGGPVSEGYLRHRALWRAGQAG